jgi:chromosome segregation ATPase
MRNMEEEFHEKFEKKESDFAEVVRKNGGMRLRMDAMKRELEGTTKLLESRNKDISDLRQGHGQNVQEIDSQLQAARKEITEKEESILRLKVSRSVLTRPRTMFWLNMLYY